MKFPCKRAGIRVLAYVKDGLVLSKKEGGEWALDNIPEVYHSLLHNALKEYADGTDTEYDMSCVKEYAKYMIEQIKARISKPKASISAR